MVDSLQHTVQDTSLDLGPLYEADRVVFTFNTLGWKALGVFAIIVGVFFLVKKVRQYLNSAYRREALQLLKRIEDEFVVSNDPSCVSDVLILLKQVGITKYGREEVAALNGEVWFQFLDGKCTNVEFRELSAGLLPLVYSRGKVDALTFQQLMGNSKTWVQEHANS